MVTGPKSGLGRYLSQSLGAELTLVSGEHLELGKSQLAETVLVHAGFRRIAPNAPPSVTDLYNNVLNTMELAQAGFRRIIYLSTIDVYPLVERVIDEGYPITNSELRSVYAYQKKICETLVLESTENSLVLRLPMLVGHGSKPNTITKIIAGEDLSLSKSSSINVITYEHVSNFIKEAEKKEVTGIFNLVASKNASIEDVVNAVESESKYGTFNYETPLLDNDKARSLLPALKTSTIENLSAWRKSL